MRINPDRLAAVAPEEVPHRRAEQLAFDIPQRHVDTGNSGHGDRASPPVGAAVQVLPNCFYIACFTPDEQGGHVLGQVGGDGHLPPIESGIANPVRAVLSLDLYCHIISPGAGNDDPHISDLHVPTFLSDTNRPFPNR